MLGPKWLLISVEDITIQVGSRRAFEHTTWESRNARTGPSWGRPGLARPPWRWRSAASCRWSRARSTISSTTTPRPQGRPYLKPGEILTLSAETHQEFLRPYADYHQARWQSFEGEEVPTVADLLEPGAEPDRRAEILRLLNLEPLLERKILHLSHGELRKVLIARLWLRSPRLLILDDPYAGLDAESRAHLVQAIEALDAARRAAAAAGDRAAPKRSRRASTTWWWCATAGSRRRASARLFIAGVFPRNVPPGRRPSSIPPILTAWRRTIPARWPRIRPCARPSWCAWSSVSIRYGEVQVLRNVTLDGARRASAGRCLATMGPARPPCSA